MLSRPIAFSATLIVAVAGSTGCVPVRHDPDWIYVQSTDDGARLLVCEEFVVAEVAVSLRANASADWVSLIDAESVGWRTGPAEPLELADLGLSNTTTFAPDEFIAVLLVGERNGEKYTTSTSIRVIDPAEWTNASGEMTETPCTD